MQNYTVKSGDTLWGISNQFGVSVTELARVNNVSADTLKVGQVLKIPIDGGTNPSNMFMYTVKSGDSLYSIAKKYNTTVGAIIDINNLKSTNLSIGQIIRIPEKYTEEQLTVPTYVNYTVKKGDSLYSIAKDFNTNVNTIMQDNSLTNSNLKLGQNLKIRVTDGVVVEECFGEEYIPIEEDNINTINYTVKKGDSLYSIAKNFNTIVSDIVKLNKLENNNLSIGQILKIPTDTISSSTKMYTVKKGDTLYSIAKSFNTSVDAIKNKNNLLSNSLTIGQVLKI